MVNSKSPIDSIKLSSRQKIQHHFFISILFISILIFLFENFYFLLVKIKASGIINGKLLFPSILFHRYDKLVIDANTYEDFINYEKVTFY